MSKLLKRLNGKEDQKRTSKMPSNENGVNRHPNGANGIIGAASVYSIPQETAKVFQDGILNNSKIARTLPDGIEEAAKGISFEGTDKPSIPINWRFAESISALKGLEAAMVNVLLKRKYGLEVRYPGERHRLHYAFKRATVRKNHFSGAASNILKRS